MPDSWWHKREFSLMLKAEVIQVTLGEQIRKQRKQKGMSQEKLAELVGVSRQAVTKWEAGQTAPSTQNLFQLAQILGVTVEELVSPQGEKPPQGQPLNQPCLLAELRQRKNWLAALAIAAGYLMIYLLGRILGGSLEQSSLLGWLFSVDVRQLSYLYGWLLKRNLFWISMGISVIPALWGKYRFSGTTLLAFALGLLLGECLGENPASAPYGHGHYGWAIWGGIFLLSIPMGIILEKLFSQGLDFKSRKLWMWCGAFLAGAAAVLLLILLNMPELQGS